MTNRTLPVASAAMTLFGPMIWAAHFIIVYTLESLLCRAAAGHWHTVLIAAVTVIAVLALLAHGTRQARQLRTEGVRRFLARAALSLDGLSSLAIVLVSATGLALPACR